MPLHPRNIVLLVDSIGEIVDKQGVTVTHNIDNKIKNEEMIRTGQDGVIKVKLLDGTIVNIQPNSTVSFHLPADFAEKYKY